MKRKDYLAVAKALNIVVCCNRGTATVIAWEMFDAVVSELCMEFKFLNPRFNEVKFKEAVFKK